ncbi:hypothetical protein BBJ28_00009158 [Nothophytophthora sp. Chile5]|nr:hypothetical protein BBJ28_00009158 [Nothophytophthora sp. Chile5]
MAPAAEDVLGELYTWDTVVEDEFSLAADDPQRDEDKTEDAYEQMIHAASSDAADPVLSLAAQLLTKHFFRFPHVQLNVVDVLLELCSPSRSQAVRIHTVRSLLQIVKTPSAAAAAETPTAATAIAEKNTQLWLQRIDAAVKKLLATEKSPVILRQATPLRHALEERLQHTLSQKPIQNSRAGNVSRDDDAASPSQRSRKPLREEKEAVDVVMDAGRTPSERKKTKRGDEAASYQPPAKTARTLAAGAFAVLTGPVPNECFHFEQRCILTGLLALSVGKDVRDEPWKKQQQSMTPNGSVRVVEDEARRRPINPPTTFSPRNCPPGPYLFLGSVPRHTSNNEIADFLSAVFPDIESASVQIKQPDRNASAYAFVSLPSAQKAREAIRFVTANKFRGRVVLKVNFARGPPVDTLLFVEKTGEGFSMEDEGYVRDCDFAKYDPDVWAILLQEMEHFGPLDYVGEGCVRFRSVEHAKAVIRRQQFNVKGHEIFPVYDTKAQFAVDSTRRASEPYAKLGFTLKSGRLGKSRDGCLEENVRMDGRREHDRVVSLKYGERSGSARSRSPPRRKYGQRSLSPVDVRGHNSPARVDEPRGRPREREGPWTGPSRSPADFRERRGPREEDRGRGGPRHGPPSPPPTTARRDEKYDVDNQRHFRDYRRNGGPIEETRQSYQRGGPPLDDRGRSPPRQGKYSTGLPTGRPRSRSRSAHQDVRMGSSPNQRSSGYHGRDDRSSGSRSQTERPPIQSDRPRYADDRSIAEVARDEQQERQRIFQQQGRRSFRDDDLSRYGGGGRGGGRDRGDGDGRSQAEFRAPPQYRGSGHNGGMYRQEAPSSQRRSSSPAPPPTRGPFSRERREEFAPMPRSREPAYSPPPSPLLQSAYDQSRLKGAPLDVLDRHRTRSPEVANRVGREPSRHERRHHERRDRDDNGHRSRHDRREKQPTRAGRSLTPSPVRRDPASASSDRKSNGTSPRRSFSRRNDGDNQAEEPAAMELTQRLKKDEVAEPQQKEAKGAGVRLVRDELFAGMDDLTVDYEEDDD